LKVLHRKMSRRRDADVVKAVLLLGTGWTEHDVAEALLLDENTVARYVERYRQDKRGPFWQMDYQGSEPKLTEIDSTGQRSCTICAFYFTVCFSHCFFPYNLG